MVNKVSEKLRMCTKYMDINKAYPKDIYPLQSIDYKTQGLQLPKRLLNITKYKCTQKMGKR